MFCLRLLQCDYTSVLVVFFTGLWFFLCSSGSFTVSCSPPAAKWHQPLPPFYLHSQWGLKAHWYMFLVENKGTVQGEVTVNYAAEEGRWNWFCWLLLMVQEVAVISKCCWVWGWVCVCVCVKAYICDKDKVGWVWTENREYMTPVF